MVSEMFKMQNLKLNIANIVLMQFGSMLGSTCCHALVGVIPTVNRFESKQSVLGESRDCYAECVIISLFPDVRWLRA